ncbi:MAG: hypothetical protein IJC80_00315, partial [Clostridia bacterium]|nr:hypothetical protein [Clostridia bacterium]
LALRISNKRYHISTSKFGTLDKATAPPFLYYLFILKQTKKQVNSQIGHRSKKHTINRTLTLFYYSSKEIMG